jgi:prolyl-tRNA editing enzyme YbaK/EbsC (Cys-tRNA(Pro) deacylase)
MALDQVRAYLAQYGMAERIRVFDVSTATVELAASAVGCEPARIAKTLSFALEEGCALIVCAGDVKIDNAKFKAQFHTKAKMLPPERVEELTGHRVGGVCPFAVKAGAAKICLDASLRHFSTVFPACGSDNSAIELTLEELSRVTGGEWVDVCKPAQGENPHS